MRQQEYLDEYAANRYHNFTVFTPLLLPEFHLDNCYPLPFDFPPVKSEAHVLKSLRVIKIQRLIKQNIKQYL